MDAVTTIKWDTYHTNSIRCENLIRYSNKDRLVKFLKTSELYFSRLDQFDDQLEGVTTYHAMIMHTIYLLENDRKLNSYLSEEQKTLALNSLRDSFAEMKKFLQSSPRGRASRNSLD